MIDLLVGIGQSKIKDSFEAGQDAAREALQKYNGTPNVLMVFSSPVYDHQRLLDGIVSVTGNVPMVGGTTAGEISTPGFSTESVVLVALRSDTLKFVTGISDNMSKNEEACGTALVEDLRGKTALKDVLSLLVLPNGMGGDGVKVIDGLHLALGEDVEIVGGYLGNEGQSENTFQFYNGKVYEDAMPGLLIIGTEEFRTGIGVRSGFESIGNRLVCTDSEGNVVKELDNEPALDLYKELLGAERSKRLPGICLEYPFGLIDEKVSLSGEEYFQLRAGLSVDHEEGTITLAGSIPEGSSITLTTASRGDIINGAGSAAEQAKESLRGAVPRFVLMFSCVGRRRVLGRRTGEEVEAVKKVLGEDVPVIGFYTFGEIGPIDKMKAELSQAKFHNETLVVWVLGSE
ncbi:MAG: hypothetical protein GY950_33545 [bacterium]|nr:hypothetical protein [bacterium]